MHEALASSGVEVVPDRQNFVDLHPVATAVEDLNLMQQNHPAFL
jgi:hypothetical protein